MRCFGELHFSTLKDIPTIHPKSRIFTKKNMKNILLCILYALISTTAVGQLVINELDADTPGSDDMEFLELLSDTPNFPLDGFVVVFFNGSEAGGNLSYFTIDLDGFSTNANGLLLIGSNMVSPVPVSYTHLTLPTKA